MRSLYTRTCVTLALALGTTHLAGCGDAAVHGRASLDTRGQASHIGAMVQVNGIYEDNTCSDPGSPGFPKRVGATWAASGQATTGSEPTVFQNDSSCKLDIVSLVVQDTAGAMQTAMAAMPIPLGGAFPAMSTLFSYHDSGKGNLMEFYGNAMMAPADFSSNFTIIMISSDTPDPLSSSSLTGQYATVASSSVVNGNIPQPADTLSFAGLTYQKGSSNLVTSVSGGLSWTLGNPSGQSYVIAEMACPATLADINAAYLWGTQKIPVSQAPSANDFGLGAGADLSMPLERCMIVGNCDSISNVCAYQLFDVTFN